MELLQAQEAGDLVHARAFTVQCAKALHQVALDGGTWENAAHLIPTPDPMSRAAFGGDEAELEKIHQYRKSPRELRQKHEVDNNGFQYREYREQEADAAAGGVKEDDWKVKKKEKGNGKGKK